MPAPLKAGDAVTPTGPFAKVFGDTYSIRSVGANAFLPVIVNLPGYVDGAGFDPQFIIASANAVTPL